MRPASEVDPLISHDEVLQVVEHREDQPTLEAVSSRKRGKVCTVLLLLHVQPTNAPPLGAGVGV